MASSSSTGGDQDMRRAEKADGLATILAIGTANPPNAVYQKDYPDYYFRVTNSDHMTELKHKFKQICDSSAIEKRHLLLTEDILKKNPNMCSFMETSLNARQDILVSEVPNLGKEAADKAIKEWGQHKSQITHLITCTSSGVDSPGADYQLMILLGLPLSVNRFMLYHSGYSAGGSVLRLAKDIAENNKGARVLIVSSEISSVISFHSPNENHVDLMGTQALFADGAAAVIVGADPDLSTEKPIFELFWASQTTIPDSNDAIKVHLKETGMIPKAIIRNIPPLIANNIDGALVEAFKPLGISDWNSIFWIIHAGVPAILDHVEEKLELESGKLDAARKVFKDYGNMWSAFVMFTLDEMRNKSAVNGCSTTGEGLEWGVLFSFGPGFTFETVVLRSVPLTN